MNERNHASCKDIHYRGSDVASSSIEAPQAVEAKAAPQPLSAIEAQLGNSDAAGAEREKQLEGWMENIKMFIRGIDVSKL